MFAILDGVSEPVRRLFRVHLTAELWIMLAGGVISLSEAVLRKSLGGSDLAVTLFSMALLFPSLLGGFWGLWLEGRDKRPVFLACGVLRYLGLAAIVLWAAPGWFLAVFWLTGLMEPCFQTAQSSFLQSNYPADVRGRMLSWVSAIGRVAFLGGTLAGGALLDAWPDYGAWILAGGGVLGFVGAWRYSAIPFTNPRKSSVGRRSTGELLRRAFGDVRRILQDNPAFDRYERNYFLYGMAFMVLLPIYVFLLVDAFQVSYKEFSLIKLVMVQVGFMVSIPAWGRMMDQRGPHMTAAAAFLALTGFPLMLAASLWLRALPLLYVDFFAFGVCMAGVHVTWTLSSVTFARGRDSTPFMGIHVLCVGVRGILGPFLGYRIYQWAGYHAVFALSAALFLCAGVAMLRSPDRRSVATWKEEEPALAAVAEGR